MARFLFKLEAVYRQRKNVEQQRRRELAVVQSRLTVLQNQLRDLDATVRVSDQDLRTNRLTGHLDLEFIAAHRRFTFFMQRKAMELAQVIAVATVHVDEARTKLSEAAKQRKVMEKLREGQLARWQEEQSRKDLADMDELAMRLAQESMDSELNSAQSQ